MTEEAQSAPVNPSAKPEPPGPRIIDSTDLLGPDRTVMIKHAADYYRLTLTRNGKLLLQK